MAKKLTVSTKFTAVDQTTAVAKRIGSSVAGISKSVSAVGRAAGRMASAIRFAAVSLVMGAAGKAVAAFGDKADDIADVSKRIGLSAEALQELQYAAAAADLSAEDLTSVLQKMNNNLGQLRAGTGTLYSNLVKTNPALARQLRTVEDSDEAFTLLMDSIAKETNVQKRAALAQAAFGKSGQAVIDMASDLAAKRKEAQAQGAIISNEDVAAGAALHANLIKVKAAFTGITNTVFGRIAASIGPVIEKLNGWILANKEIIGQKIDTVFRVIGDIFAKLGPSIAGIIERLLPAIEKLVDRVLPILVEVLDILLPLLDPLLALLDPILDIFVALAPAIKAVAEMVKAILIPVLQILKPILDVIAVVIKPIVDAIAWIAKGIGGLLSKPLGRIAEALGAGSSGTPVSPSAGSAAASAQSLSWAGTLDISGAPSGSRVTSAGSGAPAITLSRGLGIAGAGR